MRVLGVVLLIFWLTTSSGDGQTGYFATPFLTQERLARQRDAFGVLNSTAWGDFNPRLATDPPNGTEATRYLNITGFRQADSFAWEDLGRFKERCLEWSRSTRPMLQASIDEHGEPLEGAQETSSWDLGTGGAVWQNATGLVKGPWLRRNGSVNRTWSDYNFTAMTPGITWAGTHNEWNRNVTGAEGSMQLRVEDKKRHVQYDDEVVDVGLGRLSTGGVVREVAAGLTLEDSESGSTYEMRLHGVHWPRQGNMLLTTTSEKFSGIFGLPHLAPDQNFFRSSQRLLNQSVDDVLRKEERSAFADQINPWTSSASGAEDAWNPSPHCEYVVYLQVHDIQYDFSLAKKKPSWDNSDNLVQKIEDELRNPTGAPIHQVPGLQMSAVVYSPDCAYFLESKGPPHFSELSGNKHLVGFKEEIWIWNVNFCVLIMAAIIFGQVCLLKSQMRESYTPSTMGRISFWTLIVMVLADGMMFAISTVLALDSTHFYLRALILTFALFMSMMIGGSFLGEVYRTQESEWRPRERERSSDISAPRPPPTPAPATGESLPLPVTAGVATGQLDRPVIIPSDQDVDAEIAENASVGAAAVPTAGTTSAGFQQPRVTSYSTIVGRLILFGTTICFLSLAAMSWWKPVRNAFINTMAFAYMSLWIPQLVRNTQRNSRRAFMWPFMVGQSVLRILPIAYFYLAPNNMVFSEPDGTAFLVLVLWLWAQLVLLLAQDIVGPRYGMPKGWMPEAWDYYRILREDSLEAGGLPIGLASSPTTPSLERVRSLSFSSSERVKSTGTRLRTIDCAICCELLEVPVVKAGEEADGSFVGVMERRKYMVTPCRHIFHSACLEGWLRFRLQCPNCREELPPL